MKATIVGAGVFGVWIAHSLHRRGWTVRLIEQHGPANSRSSSGGETRIIRSGYGELSIYARWARQSLPEWLALEARAGERLFVRTGALFLGRNARWLAEQVAAAPGWRVLNSVRLQTLCVRHDPGGLAGEALDRHTLGWLERVNASGFAYLTPALLDGRWVARISSAASAT